MERRKQFKRWLQNERIKKSGNPIPEKVIEGYLRNIHKVSNAMYEAGVISKRLYSIRTMEELNEVFAAIKADQTYLRMNTQSENMCQKALNYYSAFTEAVCRKVEQQE